MTQSQSGSQNKRLNITLRTMTRQDVDCNSYQKFCRAYHKRFGRHLVQLKKEMGNSDHWQAGSGRSQFNCSVYNYISIFISLKQIVGSKALPQPMGALDRNMTPQQQFPGAFLARFLLPHVPGTIAFGQAIDWDQVDPWDDVCSLGLPPAYAPNHFLKFVRPMWYL